MAESVLLGSVSRRLTADLVETAERMAQSVVHLYRTTGSLMRDGAYTLEHSGGARVLWAVPSDALPPRPVRPAGASYRPSVAEATMSGRRLDTDIAFDAEMLADVREAASTSIRKMRSTDGGTNIYKPEAGVVGEETTLGPDPGGRGPRGCGPAPRRPAGMRA